MAIGVIANNLTKHYGNKAVFKQISFTLQEGDLLAITGANGAGKSTLLQIVGGLMLPTTGHISYTLTNKPIDPDTLYKHLSVVAPWVEPPTEFSATELFNWLKNLKPFAINNYNQFATHFELQFQAHKPIKTFSTGMRQKLMLAFAFNITNGLILLDEPGANLDAQNQTWYLNQLNKVKQQCSVIIASNQSTDWPNNSPKILIGN